MLHDVRNLHVVRAVRAVHAAHAVQEAHANDVDDDAVECDAHQPQRRPLVSQQPGKCCQSSQLTKSKSKIRTNR